MWEGRSILLEASAEYPLLVWFGVVLGLEVVQREEAEPAIPAPGVVLDPGGGVAHP